MQPTLFLLPGIPERPRRRVLWRAEMSRLTQLLADQRQRDRRDHEQHRARLAGVLQDLKDRIVDIERATGIADISVAPRTRPQLRAYAGR